MSSIPYLQKNDVSHQLVVNGKPFLILASELQNSSLSSAEYMQDVWPKLVAANINTVLGAVAWEEVEPEEGRFDFTNLDRVILDARSHGLHLVLLWFGSFKNGVSTYVPAWVKKDARRFPRAQVRKADDGSLAATEVLTVFDDSAPEADARAFGELMKHLKHVDGAHSTVIMVQVENEIGLLGDSRDRSKRADERFAQPVPQELVEFLDSSWDTLTPEFQANFAAFKTSSTKQGSWEDVFGQSQQTDELFMAYHYALYLDRVAAAGKREHPLPLFTNVWQKYVGGDAAAEKAFPNIVLGGNAPGSYPSGGAIVDVLDVWQRFAPALDFIAPDIYLGDYAASCARYRHGGQPLFVPEQRAGEYGARRVWAALGSFHALGASPFGADSLYSLDPLARHYRLLDAVAPLVLDAQRRPGASVGFFFDDLDDEADPTPPQTAVFGQWQLAIERSFVFGKPGPGAGMVIHLGGARFLLVGWGFQVIAKSRTRSSFTGILRFEEKVVNRETGALRTLRKLNGDETRGGVAAVMPNEDPDMGGFPVPVTIPARTMLAELEVYSIEEDE